MSFKECKLCQDLFGIMMVAGGYLFHAGLLLLKAIYVIPIGSFMVMGALFFTIAAITIWTTTNFSILVVFGVNNINL